VKPTMSPDPAELAWHLRTHADGEGLIRWTANHLSAVAGIAVTDVQPAMAALVAAGHVYPYAGGRTRARFAYFVGMERAGGLSLLPPPTIQSGPTLTMYRKRDSDLCHLCRLPVVTAWNRPREWPSLDHLTPRVQGGTDYPSNIKVSHVSCNKARRDRPIGQFAGSPLTRVWAVNG
jgi:hypothetical protein